MTNDFDTTKLREDYRDRAMRQLNQWMNRRVFAEPDFARWTVLYHEQIAMDQALDQRSQYEWFCRLEVGA